MPWCNFLFDFGITEIQKSWSSLPFLLCIDTNTEYFRKMLQRLSWKYHFFSIYSRSIFINEIRSIILSWLYIKMFSNLSFITIGRLLKRKLWGNCCQNSSNITHIEIFYELFRSTRHSFYIIAYFSIFSNINILVLNDSFWRIFGE